MLHAIGSSSDGRDVKLSLGSEKNILDRLSLRLERKRCVHFAGLSADVYTRPEPVVGVGARVQLPGDGLVEVLDALQGELEVVLGQDSLRFGKFLKKRR